jgi:hypothetical protein
MFIRRVPPTVVAFGALALLLIVTVATPGRTFAQRAQPAHASRPAAVTEGAKVTLAETSIAGPGFDGPVIAWTGTDAAHHVNFRTGSGNLSFPNKTTLPETSPFGPAISMLPTPGGTPPNFALAWTGTDANHSLNVESFPGGIKLTLHETSIATPALAFGNLNGTARLLLAWTGTDANHSLNVLPLTPAGSGSFAVGTKTVLSQFSSNAGPSLSVNHIAADLTTTFVLGWSARASRQLNFAETTDAVKFTSPLSSPLPQTSANAPQFEASSASDVCVSWTGTDATHHLNVQCTTSFPQFPAPAATKTVLPETALGAPGLAFTSNTTANIAWTGTDAAHHLNVAALQGV